MFALLWLLFSTSSSIQATQSLCAVSLAEISAFWFGFLLIVCTATLNAFNGIKKRMWKLFSCVPMKETCVLTSFTSPNFLISCSQPCHEPFFFLSPAFCNNDGLTFSWNVSFPTDCLWILTFFTTSCICHITLAPIGVESKHTIWKVQPDIANIESSQAMKLIWVFW